MKEPKVRARTRGAMIVRSFREPVATVSLAIASLLPATALAADHHAGSVGASRGPAFTFSIGRRALPASGSIHLRDFSRVHEPMKPFEVASPTPKPEPTFPSFANPLHRHHMAMIWF